MAIAKPTFTTEQQALHTEVRNGYLAAKTKKPKRAGNADDRQQYLPQHDLQILQILKTHNMIERFGIADTETQKDICEEIADILLKSGQSRTTDSVYYRLRKLFHAEQLAALNYRNTAKKKIATT